MFAIDGLSLVEHIHGHAGWLAAIALIHPAVVLRRPSRRAHLAVVLATVLVTLTAALGLALYGPYREALRQPIFASAPVVGYLFERKEHLAFGAVFLAWAGASAYFGAIAVEPTLRRPLRRAAHAAFTVAAISPSPRRCSGPSWPPTARSARGRRHRPSNLGALFSRKARIPFALVVRAEEHGEGGPFRSRWRLAAARPDRAGWRA